MSNPRFFIPFRPPDDLVMIGGDEAHHMVVVRRLGVGDAVTLFDDSGKEYQGVIEQVERGRGAPQVAVRIQSSGAADREPGVKIVLATAIPKGDRADVMIQKCAELGCHALIPMECARSVVRFIAGREGKIQKWRRVALEASKQCGRNQVMEVREPVCFADVLGLAGQCELAVICTLGADARPLKNLLAERGHPKDIMCLVGPEGGFTDEEVKEARGAGLQAVVLARSILRTETAAVAAVAIIGAEYL